MTTFRSQRSEREVWIGLVHVKPGLGHEWNPHVGGAFAATVALASSVEEFIAAATRHMRSMNLHIVEAEDVQRLTERLNEGFPDASLLALAAQLSEAEPVAVSVFDRYPHEDDDEN